MLRLAKETGRLVPLDCLELEPTRLPPSDEFRCYIVNSWREFSTEVGQDLFLIASDVSASGNRLATVDLLALDRQGCTVIVSLHQDEEPSQLTESLVCASLLASWSPARILKHLSLESTREVEDFLKVDINAINREQRLLFIAESFREEELLAATWLAQRGKVGVACVRVILARDRQSHHEYLSCLQLFPASKSQDRWPQPKEPARHATILIEESNALFERVPACSDIQTDKDKPTSELASAAEAPPSKTARIASAEEKSQGQATRVLFEAAVQAGEHTEEALSFEERVDDNGRPEMPYGTAMHATTRKASAKPKEIAQGLKLAAVVLVTVPLVIFYASPWDRWPETEALDRGAELPSHRQEPAQQAVDVVSGVVKERGSDRMISDARVYYAGKLATTDQKGRFQFQRRPENDRVHIKAVGYRQDDLTFRESPAKVELEQFDVRAIYVNRQKITSAKGRANLLALLRRTASNAIVVTVKNSRGELSIPVEHPYVDAIGAFRDQRANRLLSEGLRGFRSKGVYTIARVATFKDDLLTRKKPETALRSLVANRPIIGTGNIGWTDPAATGVQNYNFEVARAAARAGFDEVMFDFIRYPATPLSLEGVTAKERKRRLETIVGFLRRATAGLAPLNVYVGANVFGSVCTMKQVGVIGQKLEEIAAAVDYVCPMLYPSQFQPHKKYPHHVQQPYRLIRDNLRAAATRIGNIRKLRPWLQNFPDRNGSGAPLDAAQIRSQLQAANDMGTSGWMLWDPRSRYVNTQQAMADLLTANASGGRLEESTSFFGADGN